MPVPVTLVLSMLAGCATIRVPAAAAPPPPGSVRGELAESGSLATRLSSSPADLVVFYGGEQKGSMETCGCPRNPRGSLARLDAYVDAARATSPGVLVDAGYWLEDALGVDGRTRPDIAVGNAWMVRGVESGGWDALNAGYKDLPGIAEAVKGGARLPIVSANVTGPGIARWVIVERGGRKVGITGITAAGLTMSDTPGYAIGPATAAAATIDELAAQADVVVLLAYEATDAARALVRGHPAIDVVVDAGQHATFLEPVLLGHAVWVFSHYQTMRVGELRLSLAEGRVTAALDRKIDLDPDMPDDPALLKMTREARTAIDVEQKALYGP